MPNAPRSLPCLPTIEVNLNRQGRGVSRSYSAAMDPTAPTPPTPSACAARPRSWRRSRRVLPAHALLWQREDTMPYECDGLTAYRAAAAGGGAARDRGAGRRRCSRPATRSACRWWRAAPAPACRAARMPHALGVTLSLAKFNRILEDRPGQRAPRVVQCGVRNLAISEAAAPLRPVLRARPVAARSPAPSAATSPRTRAACTA